MRQGNDSGPQYRSDLTSKTRRQRAAADASLQADRAGWQVRLWPITTEIATPARSTSPRTTTSSTWPEPGYCSSSTGSLPDRVGVKPSGGANPPARALQARLRGIV